MFGQRCEPEIESVEAEGGLERRSMSVGGFFRGRGSTVVDRRPTPDNLNTRVQLRDLIPQLYAPDEHFPVKKRHREA